MTRRPKIRPSGKMAESAHSPFVGRSEMAKGKEMERERERRRKARERGEREARVKGTQNGSHAKPSPVAARSNPTKARDDDGDDDKHFVSHASERRSGLAKAE